MSEDVERYAQSIREAAPHHYPFALGMIEAAIEILPTPAEKVQKIETILQALRIVTNEGK